MWVLRQILLITLLAAAVSAAQSGPITLEPGVELYDQQIYFGQEKVYRLGHLIATEKYEVRVSSPGLYAAEFFVTLVCEMNDFAPESGPGRKLLNVEKTIFEVNEFGRISKCPPSKATLPTYGVKVFARLEGTTTDSTLLEKPISFNIILESLWFGIPARVVGLILVALVIVIGLVIVVWTAPGVPWGPVPLSRPVDPKHKSQ